MRSIPSLLCIVFYLCLLPSLGFAQNAKPLDDRMAERLARDVCIEAIDTPNYHAQCSDWLARAHCLSTYLEQRDNFERHVDTQSLFGLLQSAETRLAKDKNCSPMSKVRLWLALLDLGQIEYHPDVLIHDNVAPRDASPSACNKRFALEERKMRKKDETLWRKEQWSKIFDHFPQLLKEQQHFICHELSSSLDFEKLYKDAQYKSIFGDCVSLPAQIDEAAASSEQMLRYFEALDPKLINADARAVMLITKLRRRQFQSAKSDIEAIALDKLSPEGSAKLKAAVLEHAPSLYAQELITGGACYPLSLRPAQEKLEADRLRYAYLLETPHPLAPFVAQSEMLQNWHACAYERIATRMAWLFDHFTNDNTVYEIARNLLNNLAHHRDAKLAFALARSMSKLSPAGLDAFSKKLGPILAAQILDFSILSNTEEKIELLSAARHFANAKSQAEIDFRLGIALHQAGQEIEARKHWRAVIDQGPNAPWSREASALYERATQGQAP